MDSFSEQNTVFNFDESAEVEIQKETLKNNFGILRRAEKELKSFETLLATKERTVNIKTLELTEASEMIAQEKSDLEKERILLEIDKESFCREKEEIMKFHEKFKGKLEKYKVKKYELNTLIKKNEDILSESHKRFEAFKGLKLEIQKEQESIRIASEQVEQENQLVIKQIHLLSIKKVEHEKNEEKLEKQKKFHEKEKIKLNNERENIQKLKVKLNEERDNLQNEIKQAEIIRKQYEECMEVQKDMRSNIVEPPANVSKLFEIIQKQVEVFNIELTIKEKRFQEREQNLFKNSKKLSNLSKGLYAAEKYMKKCKSELLKIQSKIFPEIKKLYSLSKDLLECSKLQVMEVNDQCQNLNKDIDIISEIKVLTASHQDHIDKHIREIEKKENELKEFAFNLEERQSNMSAISFISDSRMDSTISELEQNLKALQDKQEEVDKDAEENVKNAEYLRKSIQEIEDSKKKLLNERIRYKEKNNLLESKQKLIAEKFQELESFHLNLRKKEIELQNLQKQICNVEILNKSMGK